MKELFAVILDLFQNPCQKETASNEQTGFRLWRRAACRDDNKVKGFTFIELLVVVLIIGILAAVALPQYQLAVDKSRMAGAVSLASSLRKGQEVYYMSNGMYTVSLEDLDIDLSSNCTRLGDGMIQCPMFVVDNIYGTLGSNLVVNQAAVFFTPSGSLEQKEAIVHVYYEHSSKPNQITCEGITDRGKRLCKSLGYTPEE